MAQINHGRPKLRYLDNLKRELSKVGVNPDVRLDDFEWPTFLRPIASKPVALRAFFDVLASLDAWFGQQGNIVLDEPPDNLRANLRSFALSAVFKNYDPLYRGRDWLSDGAKNEGGPWQEFCTLLLQLDNLPLDRSLRRKAGKLRRRKVEARP